MTTIELIASAPHSRAARRRARAALTKRYAVPLALIAGIGAAACSSSPAAPATTLGSATTPGATDGGHATIALSVVPIGVSCVEIDVAGVRDVANLFSVAPNQPAVLSLTGLPLGSVTFTGLAYPLACSAVTGPVQATWISKPTAATLVAETVTDVALALVPNGQASVGVGFDPDDAGSDGAAGDAAIDATADTGPVVSFANPLQLVVPFNANTVLSNPPGLMPLVPIDGNSISDGHDFATQNVAQALNSTSSGLPTSASFGPVGTTVPFVQLGWNNPAANNSFILANGSPTPIQVSIPPGQYQELQVYATSTLGGAVVQAAFTYEDGMVPLLPQTIPDWCVSGPLPSDVSILASSSRVSGTAVIDTVNVCNIYAVNFEPDPARTLVGFSLLATSGTPGGNFVLYGATAW